MKMEQRHIKIFWMCAVNRGNMRLAVGASPFSQGNAVAEAMVSWADLHAEGRKW